VVSGAPTANFIFSVRHCEGATAKPFGASAAFDVGDAPQRIPMYLRCICHVFAMRGKRRCLSDNVKRIPLIGFKLNFSRDRRTSGATFISGTDFIPALSVFLSIRRLARESIKCRR
jgi:hypothetical protein